VIDFVDDFALDDRFDFREVDDVAGLGVDRSGHRDVERVVVSVPVRVVALSEDGAILFVGQRGIVHAVRGVELEPADDRD